MHVQTDFWRSDRSHKGWHQHAYNINQDWYYQSARLETPTLQVTVNRSIQYWGFLTKAGFTILVMHTYGQPVHCVSHQVVSSSVSRDHLYPSANTTKVTYNSHVVRSTNTFPSCVSSLHFRFIKIHSSSSVHKRFFFPHLQAYKARNW